MGAHLRLARTALEAVLEAAADDDARIAAAAHRVADKPRRAALHLDAGTGTATHGVGAQRGVTTAEDVEADA
eukprot:scaffold81622_cov66-Phaeocystis_antarctica.AAC.2